MNERIMQFIGSTDISIVEAMEKIDINAKGILFIVNEKEQICGSLSDGDIRRWIIKTGDLTAKTSLAMNTQVKCLSEEENDQANFYMKKLFINAIPIVDAENHILNISFQGDANNFKNNDLNGIPVIIMAGGKGTRLYPYTKILPKPLIPIGDVPIIERIMNQFNNYGISKFYITVNYKKAMIKAYLRENNLPYEIEFIEENKPLGTAGSIRLIEEELDNPVIISNCDVLIEANYSKILEYHIKNENVMTIVSSLKNMIIPYGVLNTSENGIVNSINEKPHYSVLINTGMYIVNPDVIKKIPQDSVYHMTDLADLLIREHYKVGMYPISENSYLDMGQFEEMKRMEAFIETKGEIDE